MGDSRFARHARNDKNSWGLFFLRERSFHPCVLRYPNPRLGKELSQAFFAGAGFAQIIAITPSIGGSAKHAASEKAIFINILQSAGQTVFVEPKHTFA